MKKTDSIFDLISENGYLFTKDVIHKEITNSLLKEFSKRYGLERVAHGIYITSETFLDEYYIISEKNKRAVFSLESSLYLNNLMEHEPDYITVTIPRGYNATHLRKNNINVISKEKEIYESGITYLNTNMGNPVRTYDIDRSICEMIKYKNKFDIQVFTYALKEYSKREDKNLNNLIVYSKLLKVEKNVRNYIEVLM